jgi:hypothetical protein
LAFCIFFSALAHFIHLFPRSLDPLLPAKQKSGLFFVDLASHVHVESLRANYQMASVLVAVISWMILAVASIILRRQEAQDGSPSIIRHPIVVVGLGVLLGFAVMLTVKS